jgi:hypothetical protein
LSVIIDDEQHGIGCTHDAALSIKELISPSRRRPFTGLVSSSRPATYRCRKRLQPVKTTEIEKWWPIIKVAGIKAE